MEHGDIQVQITLRGEPQKVTTYWRGSLRELTPTEASVTILRPRGRPKYGWSYDTNLYFDAITHKEAKRAELSISEKALEMRAEEIKTAAELTEKLAGWLLRKEGIPLINTPILNANIAVRCVGGSEIVSTIESFADKEVLTGVVLGAVYTQGEPRRPDVRWLPTIVSTDTSVVLEHLGYFERSLADGQSDEIRLLLNRLIDVFRKKLAARKEVVCKRIVEKFGYGAPFKIRDRPITDKDIEEDYADLLEALEAGVDYEGPRNRITAWRADD